LLVSFGLSNLTTLPAEALLTRTLTATVTADNHYGLFTGNDDASSLLFIGRNEIGPFHQPDLVSPFPSEVPLFPFFNWESPESWQALIPNTHNNIYVVVWGDEAVRDSWVGEFTLDYSCEDCQGNVLLSGTKTFLSDPSWEFLISDNPTPGYANPEDFGDVPANSEINQLVSFANANNTWMPGISLGYNDATTLPWGTIPGISTLAQFLDASTPNNAYYTLFRKEIVCPDCPPPPPECIPEPLTILGSAAALGFGAFFKRKLKSSKSISKEIAKVC
jgi:hypothetical protein